MKKVDILLISVLSISSLEASPYVELRSGANMPFKMDGISYKSSLCVDGEIGYKINDWRLALQFDFRQFEPKNVKNPSDKHYTTVFGSYEYFNKRFTDTSILVNAYYDYKVKEYISFYVGVGVGVTRSKYHFYDKDNALTLGVMSYDLVKYALTAQVMTGVTYDINEHWSLSLGYRCMKMENIKFYHDNDIIQDAIKSLKTPYLHSLELGLRYSF